MKISIDKLEIISSLNTLIFNYIIIYNTIFLNILYINNVFNIIKKHLEF